MMSLMCEGVSARLVVLVGTEVEVVEVQLVAVVVVEAKVGLVVAVVVNRGRGGKDPSGRSCSGHGGKVHLVTVVVVMEEGAEGLLTTYLLL